LKRLISYSLIFILLLNVMGYYGVFMGLEYTNDRVMFSQFENNEYAESQTVSIKIPMAIPYATDDADFKRVDGKFEHQGETFRLVKQKYSNDTLTVICYKDFKNGRIKEALADYVKTFGDSPQDQQSNSKVSFSLIKDFLPETFSMQHITLGWQSDLVLHSSSIQLVSSFFPSVVHPPERG
jgi:hypothetical protein